MPKEQNTTGMTALGNYATDTLKQFETPVEPKEEVQTKAHKKKKAGRPKTKDVKGTCKKINIALPKTLLDQWEDIKIVHGSNQTEYITKLIEKDMKSNYDHYKALADSLKNI